MKNLRFYVSLTFLMFLTMGLSPAYSSSMVFFSPSVTIGDNGSVQLFDYNPETGMFDLAGTGFSYSYGNVSVSGYISGNMDPDPFISYTVRILGYSNTSDNLEHLALTWLVPLVPPVDYQTFVRASLTETDNLSSDEALLISQTSQVSTLYGDWCDLQIPTSLFVSTAGPRLGPAGTWFAMGATLSIGIPPTSGVYESVDYEIKGDTKMNAVPVPATLLLFCSGLFGIAAFGNRKRK